MVEIIDETTRFRHRRQLRSALGALMSELSLGDREVTVVLLDDASIRAYNRDHRGVDEPTDVLSYPAMEPDDRGFPQVPHLGDILISVDTAARQAVEAGHSLLAEVLTLAAHGLTHLVGFDHDTEEQWQTFLENQQRILALQRGA